MANNTFKISEIPQIQNIDTDDLLLVADKENGQYHSRSMSMEQVANTIYAKTSSSLSNDGYALTESLTVYAKTSDLSDLPTIKQDIINLGAVSSDFQLTAEAGSMAYESKDSYKSYDETTSALSNDGYALKSDIPSANDISADIHLSDYSLTSHSHNGTYLKEVPSTYKTYSDTKNDLSNDGYAKTSDLSDIPTIKQDIIKNKTQLSAMLSCLPLNKFECSLSNIIDALYSLKAQFEIA